MGNFLMPLHRCLCGISFDAYDLFIYLKTHLRYKTNPFVIRVSQFRPIKTEKF